MHVLLFRDGSTSARALRTGWCREWPGGTDSLPLPLPLSAVWGRPAPIAASEGSTTGAMRTPQLATSSHAACRGTYTYSPVLLLHHARPRIVASAELDSARQMLAFRLFRANRHGRYPVCCSERQSIKTLVASRYLTTHCMPLHCLPSGPTRSSNHKSSLRLEHLHLASL